MFGVRNFIEKKKASRKEQGDLLLEEAWRFYGSDFGFVLGKEDLYGAHYYCGFEWMTGHPGHPFKFKKHEYNYSCCNDTISHTCCGWDGRSYRF